MRRILFGVATLKISRKSKRKLFQNDWFSIPKISKKSKRTKKARFRAFSLSHAVLVSPEGRSSEVAGARLAWRDKISKKSKMTTKKKPRQ